MSQPVIDINRPDLYDQPGPPGDGQLPYTLPAGARSPLLILWAILAVILLITAVTLIVAGVAIQFGAGPALIAAGAGIGYIGWRIEAATQ